MIQIAYEKAKIVRLGKDGLEYLADDGSTRFIDFALCGQNLEKEFPRLGSNRAKYIGYRDSSAKPPKVTLLTDPPTVFLFPMPKAPKQISTSSSMPPSAKFLQRDPEDFRDFREFQMRLNEAGWSTIDHG